MNIEIRNLRKRDFKKAIQFAIQGMHFERYTENSKELYLYGKYFLYLEMNRATQILAAYTDNQLVGVLMAHMNGEPKAYCSFWKKLYVKIVDAIMKLAFKDGNSAYDRANAQMYQHYIKHASPDGEICFLAADPAFQGKGIGSKLLDELSRQKKGKLIYLYTDNNCTYQFYDHKGFVKSEEKEICIEIHKKSVPLKCFLYSKKM